jgi:hypothetical protein
MLDMINFYGMFEEDNDTHNFPSFTRLMAIYPKTEETEQLCYVAQKCH